MNHATDKTVRTHRQQIVTSPTVKPPPHPFYGEYSERGKSPWHREAFVGTGFEDRAPDQSKKWTEGWFLTDGYGTQIGFVEDGTVFETKWKS